MQFIESTHKYTQDGINYTPVTYFLKSFQPYVDWDKEAEKKAKKLKISKEELLKQWDEKRNKAAEKGTAFHKKMEDELLGKSSEIYCNVDCLISAAVEANGIKEDNSLILEDNTIYPEKMIWTDKYKICGTADLVKVVNGKINVLDFKTNEKLEFESWKHPILGSKKLLYPLNTFDDCNGVLYEFQINIYMYMLLQKNRKLKIGDMQILHVLFDENGDDIGTIPYNVRNLQAEVKLMFEHFKSKNV